jgi:hypothetical protein
LRDVEQGSDLSFSRGGQDLLDDDTGDVYGAVRGRRSRWVMLAAEVENASRASVLVTRRDMTLHCGW